MEGFSGTLDPYYRGPATQAVEMKWAMCTGTNRNFVASDGGSSSLVGDFTNHIISTECGLFEPNVPVNTAISLACDRMQWTRKDSNGYTIQQEVPLMLMNNILPDFCLHETDDMTVHFDVCICYRRDTDSEWASFVDENLRPSLKLTVFCQTIPGEAPRTQIARAVCNSSIVILIISERTFAGINTLQVQYLPSTQKAELASLLLQMEMILEIYEHRKKSVNVLPVYFGDVEQDHDSNFEPMFKRVERSKCWPTVDQEREKAWVPLVRQKALLLLRLADKRLSRLLHDRGLDQFRGVFSEIPSLIKGLQVSQTMQAFHEGFGAMPSLVGRKADAGTLVARTVHDALSILLPGLQQQVAIQMSTPPLEAN